MGAREATSADIERMLELADIKRRQYEPHAPVFQRPASNAVEIHRPWFQRLIDDPKAGTFVHEEEPGEVDGFVIITTGPAPPAVIRH